MDALPAFTEVEATEGLSKDCAAQNFILTLANDFLS